LSVWREKTASRDILHRWRSCGCGSAAFSFIAALQQLMIQQPFLQQLQCTRHSVAALPAFCPCALQNAHGKLDETEGGGGRGMHLLLGLHERGRGRRSGRDGRVKVQGDELQAFVTDSKLHHAPYTKLVNSHNTRHKSHVKRKNSNLGIRREAISACLRGCLGATGRVAASAELATRAQYLRNEMSG
jgi:hypothetical protein